MKKAFQRLTVLLTLLPWVVAASPGSHDGGYSSSYKLGWYVGWFIRAFGPYLLAAALLGIFGWLWFRRAKARRIRGDGS